MFPSSCSLQPLFSASPRHPAPPPLSRYCHLYYSADKIKVPQHEVSGFHFPLQKISEALSPTSFLHRLPLSHAAPSGHASTYCLLYSAFSGSEPLAWPELGLQQKALLCQIFLLMSRFRPFLSCLEPLMCSSRGWKGTPPLKSARLYLLPLPNPWYR